MKGAEVAGRTVTLKLRTARFKIRTRSLTLVNPTQLADALYRNASELLRRECDGTAFRLIGVGASGLVAAEAADPIDLADPEDGRRALTERAVDDVRARFGGDAIAKGRGLRDG